VIVERDTKTGSRVAHIPGFRGARGQGTAMDELQANLTAVVAMLLEDGEPHIKVEFVGTQTVRIT
jgi:predicted RNase H-like HicB family nuclease